MNAVTSGSERLMPAYDLLQTMEWKKWSSRTEPNHPNDLLLCRGLYHPFTYSKSLSYPAHKTLGSEIGVARSPANA